MGRFFLTLIFFFSLTANIFSEEMRTWKSSSGQYRVKATLKSVSPDKKEVVLIKRNDQEITVEVKKLSEEDKAYIDNYLANEDKSSNEELVSPFDDNASSLENEIDNAPKAPQTFTFIGNIRHKSKPVYGISLGDSIEEIKQNKNLIIENTSYSFNEYNDSYNDSYNIELKNEDNFASKISIGVFQHRVFGITIQARDHSWENYKVIESEIESKYKRVGLYSFVDKQSSDVVVTIRCYSTGTISYEHSQMKKDIEDYIKKDMTSAIGGKL